MSLVCHSTFHLSHFYHSHSQDSTFCSLPLLRGYSIPHSPFYTSSVTFTLCSSRRALKVYLLLSGFSIYFDLELPIMSSVSALAMGLQAASIGPFIGTWCNTSLYVSFYFLYSFSLSYIIIIPYPTYSFFSFLSTLTTVLLVSMHLSPLSFSTESGSFPLVVSHSRRNRRKVSRLVTDFAYHLVYFTGGDSYAYILLLYDL